MNQILIRKLKFEDVEDVNRIYTGIIQKKGSTDFVNTIEEHAKRNSDESVVAEVNGSIVGFLISYILMGGFGIEKSAWIPMLGVNPEFMGQGIGTAMANHVFKHYKSIGIQNIYTSVNWYSADLLSFFRILGFDRSDFVNLQKKLE